MNDRFGATDVWIWGWSQGTSGSEKLVLDRVTEAKEFEVGFVGILGSMDNE